MAVPLSELTLRVRHHLAALWWLGLLYRRPQDFHASLDGLSLLRAQRAGASLFLHALPWMFAFALLGGILLRIVIEPGQLLAIPIVESAVGILSGIALGIGFWATVEVRSGIAFGLAFGLAFGIALGIALGIAFIVSWMAVAIAVGIALGIAFGISFGILVGMASGVPVGMGVGMGVAIGSGITFGAVFGIGLGNNFGIGLGSKFGIAFGMAVGIPFGIGLLRAYYYPAHVCFVFPAIQGRWYPFHPVAWDDMCSLPFIGLHRLLVAYAATDPAAGEREIERLITAYPSQRGEALKARTILVARTAGAELDLAALDAPVASLPDGDTGFLKQIPGLRARIGEIAQLQRRLDTMARPAFREPVAAQLVTTIENFRHQLAGFREPLASEFRAAAEAWETIAQAQLNHARTVLAREPAAQVFRAGDPVDRSKEAFVPRMQVIEELEGQIMLATGCPGLLLYGRRRMGKSTLLCNLNGFLPESVLVAGFSMQNPAAFNSLPSFTGLVARTAREKLGNGAPAGGPETLPDLFHALDGINARLGESGQQLLLACDEFEAIDEKIGQGVFTLDLLGTIRESVQTHRHVTWVFIGSHDLGELSHADWSSYFVSLRMIEVLPFTPDETRLLLTEPLKWSPLWRERRAERPRVDPSFWGEGGIERIQAETGGWPHLVQLLAETAVDIANDKGVRELNAEMLETAFAKGVGRGDAVLRQLVEGENRSDGERAYLLGFRDRETQPPPDNADVRGALRRRRLVLDGAEGWRLRAPLMRRWLIDRC